MARVTDLLCGLEVDVDEDCPHCNKPPLFEPRAVVLHPRAEPNQHRGTSTPRPEVTSVWCSSCGQLPASTEGLCQYCRASEEPPTPHLVLGDLRIPVHGELFVGRDPGLAPLLARSLAGFDDVSREHARLTTDG